MPKKIAEHKKYGQKLISLFARLLYSREKHSLTELSKFLDCSKQTILRLIEDLELSLMVNVETTMEGNRKFVRIKKDRLPPINLTEHEIYTLQMCQAFTRHLLGKEQFEKSVNALYKSISQFSPEKSIANNYFESFTPGTIDYTPHQDSIRVIIEAMSEKKVCRLEYKRLGGDKPKLFYIKPLKMFSHKDTVYLNARMAKYPGKKYVEPKFDPLLAVHRIQSVEKTDTAFEFPDDYNFEKVYKQNFGVIKEEEFEVEIEFTGYAANYVAERIWSSDQVITPLKKDGILITFSTSSKEEIVSWILSFGDEAMVLKPKWLKDELVKIVQNIDKQYKK